MLQKQVAVKSTFWAGIEQYITQGVNFLSSIVMARLLLPEDYGILAMLFIFIDLSAMITDMGFTTSLIRKQDCSKADFSTVFYTNIIISILIYIVFYLCSPIIADFYSQPILQKIIPAIGTTFILNSLYAIPSTRLTKDLKFNVRAKIVILESILTAVCGITLACMGYGVWALVVQIIFKSFLRFLFFTVAAKWRPSLMFSFNSLKGLYSFGSKVLGANLLFTIYQNVYSVIIGKYLSTASLGYFSRADGYSKLIPINISTVLMKVMLPLISKIQEYDDKLISINRQTILVTSFVIFPLSMLLAGAASPLISIMITDKWLPCVPILQILCLAIMTEHIAWINWDFILAKGHSNLVLKNRILVCLFSIIALFLTIRFGILWVAVAKLASSLFTVTISIFYLKKVLSIKYGTLAKELIIMFLTSILLGLATYISFQYLSYTLLNITLVLTTDLILYIGTSKILFREPLATILNLLSRK